MNFEKVKGKSKKKKKTVTNDGAPIGPSRQAPSPPKKEEDRKIRKNSKKGQHQLLNSLRQAFSYLIFCFLVKGFSYPIKPAVLSLRHFCTKTNLTLFSYQILLMDHYHLFFW